MFLLNPPPHADIAQLISETASSDTQLFQDNP